MMIVGAIFVLLYPFVGGFWAEIACDFIQAIVMIAELVPVFVLVPAAAVGLGAVVENAKIIPGLLGYPE